MDEPTVYPCAYCGHRLLVGAAGQLQKSPGCEPTDPAPSGVRCRVCDTIVSTDRSAFRSCACR